MRTRLWRCDVRDRAFLFCRRVNILNYIHQIKNSETFWPCPYEMPPTLCFGIKRSRGNQGERSPAAMSFGFKAFASALFLSAAVFGLTVQIPGHFEINAQPKGIDVSSHQGDVDWRAVVANGVSFAYIKATEGTSEAVACSESCGALTSYFSLQESLLFCTIHRRHKRRSHSRWLPLCPS